MKPHEILPNGIDRDFIGEGVETTHVDHGVVFPRPRVVGEIGKMGGQNLVITWFQRLGRRQIVKRVAVNVLRIDAVKNARHMSIAKAVRCSEEVYQTTVDKNKPCWHVGSASPMEMNTSSFHPILGSQCPLWVKSRH